MWSVESGRAREWERERARALHVHACGEGGQQRIVALRAKRGDVDGSGDCDCASNFDFALAAILEMSALISPAFTHTQTHRHTCAF